MKHERETLSNWLDVMSVKDKTHIIVNGLSEELKSRLQCIQYTYSICIFMLLFFLSFVYLYLYFVFGTGQ